MKTLFGLPEQVRFCVRCCISNQRPNSCVEFEHTADSKKTTINFDEEGVCDACRVAERKKEIDWLEREDELCDMLDKYRSRDGSPDIVIPGSGGKDSFFTAHILKHKYGMHPLLVTWAPAIFTQVGWRNLVRWQSISTHQLHTPNREVHRLLTRLSVENLFHPFAPFIYGQKALAPKLACLHKIKLCMFGESEAEYGNPRDDALSAKRSRNYHSNMGRVYLGGVSVDELRYRYGLTDTDLSPYMPAYPEDLDKAQVDVRYLGYYLKWKPQECFYYATEHGGFETSQERTPGTYSKYNSLDDALDDLHYYTTWIKFGIGRASYDAAQEIRSGDIERAEGVALVRKFDGEWPARFESEIWDYLSVEGFPKMDKSRFLELAEKFKSPHLWDGDKLRHTVYEPAEIDTPA